jgi:hypothetical protein
VYPLSVWKVSEVPRMSVSGQRRDSFDMMDLRSDSVPLGRMQESSAGTRKIS